MHMDNANTAPSPKQPLNGQGVLRITRLDGPTAKTSGETKEMARTNDTVQGVGSPKTPNRHLVMTTETDQAMAQDRSGSDIVTCNLRDPVTGAPQSRLSSDTEAKPKQQRRKKNRSQQKTHMDINALVGPQSETWTKFFVLHFSSPENEQPLSNMKIWVGLKNLLQNSEFSCVRRNDGSVLVDAKTECNADIIAKTKELWNTKITTS